MYWSFWALFQKSSKTVGSISRARTGTCTEFSRCAQER